MATFLIDGSDTSWLVYADYLEDQDIDATHIREEIAKEEINIWSDEFYYKATVGGVGWGGVGATIGLSITGRIIRAETAGVGSGGNGRVGVGIEITGNLEGVGGVGQFLY